MALPALYQNISVSTQIKAGQGKFFGFIINSAAATATIKFWDALTATAPILLNTITYTAASAQGTATCIIPDGIEFRTGLYCTIAVAAMDVTILYR